MNTFKEIIRSHERILFLTGAGISVDSGIPDFQYLDKNWNYEEDRYNVFSLPFFKQEPKRFWEIYMEIFGNKRVTPNRFHYFIAALEDKHQVSVITQNVDGLHALAGSSKVFTTHGDINTLVCIKCLLFESSEKYKTWIDYPKCPKCGYPLKPNISLFFEGVQITQNKIREQVFYSDLVIIAGTELKVSPVNEIPIIAKNLRRKTIWINQDTPPKGYSFDHQFIMKIEDLMDSLNQ